LCGNVSQFDEEELESIKNQLEHIENKQNLERLNVITYFNVKNDGTDTTEELNTAINSGYPLYFPAGVYLHTDKIVITNTNTPNWVGEGSNKTIIKFNNPDIEAGIYRRDCQSANWKIKGMTFDGTSKTLKSSIVFDITQTDRRHGIYSDVRRDFPGSTRPSYDLHFEDVQCCKWSGTGFLILDWFQQKYEGCYARNIGLNGFELGGDQATTFINSMNFNLDIDGASWWFLGGTPFLQGLNCGVVGTGLKLGTDSSHIKGLGYCKPTIVGLNVEPINEGGTGIYIENGSGLISLGNIVLYTDRDKNVEYGVYAKYLNDMSTLFNGIVFNKNGSGEYLNKIFIKGHNANSGGILNIGDLDESVINKPSVLINLYNKNGNFNLNSVTTTDFNLVGKVTVKTVTITSNYSIKRDSGQQDDYIVLADATDNNINISIDYPSYLKGRQITFKKIDNSSNTVTLSPLGGNLEGKSNYLMNTQYSTVTILSDGTKWHIINKI
jgi:hypothetical protein